MAVDRKIMQKICLIITPVAVMTAIALLLIASKQSSVYKGQLDLSGYDFAKQGIIHLDGEWVFYPGEFVLFTKHEDNQVKEGGAHYINVPGTWNHYQANGEVLSGFGAATYRMTVTGVKPNTPLALKIPPQSTAYRLYINEKLVARNGLISAAREGFVPQYQPQTVIFTPSDTHFSITMQIANFTYARGGMWYVLSLGTPAQIAQVNKLITYRDSFLLGNYFIMFLFCMAMFSVRRNKYALLYFALLCLLAAGRVLIYGNYIMSSLVSSFRIPIVIDYLTLIWFPVLLVFLADDLLDRLFTRRLIRPILITAVVCSAIVLLSPISFFTALVLLFELNALAIGLFFITLIVLRSNNKSKWTFVLGVYCMLLSALYDILYQNCVIGGLDLLSPVGFYIMLLFWAIVLANNYAAALITSNKALRELRMSTEREQLAELRFLHSQIKPHFLYNALSAIANVCSKDGPEGEKLILDLARFLRTSYDFSSHERMIALESELSLIDNYIDIEKARFGNKINYHRQIAISLNTEIPQLIIEPLVENAVRHGITKKKEGGEIWLRVFRSDDGIYIEVCDNGVGMEPEKVSLLLDSEVERRGVGLQNIHERLIKLYGKGLTIESGENIGTKVSFMIREEGRIVENSCS